MVRILVLGVHFTRSVEETGARFTQVLGVDEHVFRGCRDVFIVVPWRIRLLPIDDCNSVWFIEQFVEHLAEAEQLPVVDADSEHSPGFKHRLHHLQARPHEPHPLGVSCAVVKRDKLTKAGVVGVFIPAVVVAEVVAGVVGRIGEHEVDMSPLLVERDHRLEVVALD